jgi:hypothetical protein
MKKAIATEGTTETKNLVHAKMKEMLERMGAVKAT